MERTVTVVPEAGLHARPASQFVATANEYDSEIRVGRAGEERTVPANSLLSVTGLDVRGGEDVRIVAEGADAADALDALESLLSSPVAEGREDEEGDAGAESGAGDDGVGPGGEDAEGGV